MADDPISDYLLAFYPKKLQLDDGTALTIRRLIPQDRAQMGGQMRVFHANKERIPKTKDSLAERAEFEL